MLVVANLAPTVECSHLRWRWRWRYVEAWPAGRDNSKESIPPPRRPGPKQIVVVAAFDLIWSAATRRRFSLWSLRCESGDKSPHSKITSPDHIRRNEMDDSARAAANPSSFRAARHAAESLRTHIRNTWGQTGKTAAARVRPRLCKTSKAKQEWCASLILWSAVASGARHRFGFVRRHRLIPFI